MVYLNKKIKYYIIIMITQIELTEMITNNVTQNNKYT